MWCLLGTCACGAGAETEPAQAQAEAGRRLVLGTGEADFQPIEGEPRLPLVAGIQGGFHVWASFLVYRFAMPRAEMVLETRVEDDPEASMVMRASLMLREELDADGLPVLAFAGFPAQVFAARCAQDKRVSLHVSLTDADGYTVEDTRHCIAMVPERYRARTCD